MKTYAIIRFEMDAIRTANTQTAQKKIDRDTRLALKHIEDARIISETAQREYMDTNPADVATAAKLQDKMNSFALFAKEQTEEIDKYIESQMALFAAKGLDSQRAYKEAIIPTGETLPNGQMIFRIVKRETSLEPVDDADDSGASVRASVGYGERIGMSREQRRGKYNDAGLLIEQTAASVDASEVVPFASACV